MVLLSHKPLKKSENKTNTIIYQLPWNIQEIISKISGSIVTSLVNSGSA